jgi:CubicO group peptidase (beta-lactamase class C family)
MGSPVGALAERFEQTVAAFVKAHRLPGAAAGVVHGDELVWSGGYGYADVARRSAPDVRTMYRIASITKTFTGTAILQLRDEGMLHLDDPAVAYLPELKDAASPFGLIETVTIRRLLSHESGLMGDPPGTDWTKDIYESSPEVNLRRVADIGTRVPPNTQQKYSNLAFQLLGEIVGRISGVPYEAYVRANILEPLELTSTDFGPLRDDLASRAAIGYRGRWMNDEFTPADRMKDFPAAEGGLWSCVEDLARWLSAQFAEDGGERGGAQILAGRTLKEMHRPRYIGNDAWTEAWCIAWYAVRKDDKVWIQHSGGLPGFISNACFRVQEKVGAIALLNGIAEATELSIALGELAREAATAAPVPAEPPAQMPAAFADLLGLYADPAEALLVRCEWRDGKLTFVEPNEAEWRPTLAAGEDADRFTVEPGVRESGETVAFHRRADGRVSSVSIGPFSLSRFDPVDERSESR